MIEYTFLHSLVEALFKAYAETYNYKVNKDYTNSIEEHVKGLRTSLLLSFEPAYSKKDDFNQLYFDTIGNKAAHHVNFDRAMLRLLASFKFQIQTKMDWKRFCELMHASTFIGPDAVKGEEQKSILSNVTVDDMINDTWIAFLCAAYICPPDKVKNVLLLPDPEGVPE